VTRLWVRRLRDLFQFPAENIFSLLQIVHVGSPPPPPTVPYSTGIGTLSSVMKHPGCETDNSFLSNVEVKNAWSSTPTPASHHNEHKDCFIYAYIYMYNVCVRVCVCACVLVCMDIVLQLYYHSSLNLKHTSFKFIDTYRLNTYVIRKY
jgi:hypothetical protein